jgi:hypothetical protein
MVLAGVGEAIKTARSHDGEAAAAALLDKLSQGTASTVAGGLAYEAFEDALWRRTRRRDGGRAVPQILRMGGRGGRRASIINDRNSPWWDDITTVEKGSRDDIFILAIRAEKLDGDYGGESKRGWDRVRRVQSSARQHCVCSAGSEPRPSPG